MKSFSNQIRKLKAIRTGTQVISLCGALTVLGCASETDIPLRSFKLPEDKSGQIKIRTQNCVSNSVINTCLTGILIINGQSVGKLSKTFQSYSTNVPAGPLTISICPPHNRICITKKGEIKPGERKEFLYLEEFVQLQPVVDLREINQDITQELKEKRFDNDTRSHEALDNSKKCTELGFKTGTSSFERCLQKLGLSEF
jgi:hypothetical protein